MAKKAVKNKKSPSKSSPKPAAKKPVSKPASKKPAAKPAAKKSAAKAAKKDIKKVVKTGAKPVAKPSVKKAPVKKPVVKPAAKKPAAKPAMKGASVKAVLTAAIKSAKPAAKKAISAKVAAKVVTKPVAKKPAAKPVAKPQRLTPAPLPAVPAVELTEAQLQAVKTGLGKKELELYRKSLLEHRCEIVGDMQGMEAARNVSAGDLSHMPLHMADVGSDNYDQEFTLGILESERKILNEIDAALVRMDKGYYGVCLETGKPIERPRLEAMPWAKYGKEAAQRREKLGY